MSDLDDIRKQFDALKTAPSPVAPPKPVVRPQVPPQVQAPASTGDSYLDALKAKPQNREGVAWRQKVNELQAARVPKPDLSLGDVLDLRPEDADAAGFQDAAQAIRSVHDRVGAPLRLGGPTGDNASPYASEWGTQALEKLRTVPLQRSSGTFGMGVGNAEQRLAELYFMKAAREQNLPPPAEMAPEQFQSLMAESKDKAHRETRSITEVHEQQGNVMAPLDVGKEVKDTVEGKNLPLAAYLAVPSLAFMGSGYGPEAKDNYLYNLMAPFIALARPGVVSSSEDGKPVDKRETKMGWMFRLAPSTAVASWLLDPSLDWKFGGEKGFGGTEHINKIVRGYQLTDEMPRIAEAYDKVTPWESGPWEKTIASAIPIGALMMIEPDAVSVGTGLAMAPISKAVREIGLGEKVLKSVYKPALEEWKAAAASGKSLADIAESAGPKGSVKRWFFDAVAGDTISAIVRDSAAEVGEKGAKLGPAADIDQVAGRNIPALQAQATSKLTEVQDALKSTAAEVDKLAGEMDDAVAKETVETHVAASDAVTRYLDAERALVGSSVLRGGQEELKAGDLVINSLTGEIGEFKGFHSGQEVARSVTKTEPSVTAVVRPYNVPGAAQATIPLGMVDSAVEGADLTALQAAVDTAKRKVAGLSPSVAKAKPAVAMTERAAKLLDSKIKKQKETLDWVTVALAQAEKRTGLARDDLEIARLSDSVHRADRDLQALQAKLPTAAVSSAAAVSPGAMASAKAELAAAEAELAKASKAPSKTRVPRLVPMDTSIKSVEELEKGGLAIDSLTGDIVHVDGFHATSQVTKSVEQAAEKGTEATIQTASGPARVSLQHLDRLGNPSSWPDVQIVMRDLQSVKKQFAKLFPALKAARDMGDAKTAAKILSKIGQLKGAAVKNMTDLSFATLEAAYRDARKGMVEATGKLDRMKATGQYANPLIAKGMAQLEKHSADLESLLKEEAAASRQKAALDAAHATFLKTLGLYDTSLTAHLDALARGTMEQGAFRNGLIDTMVKPGGVLDGAAYYNGLAKKYGAEAVDRVLGSAIGRPFKAMMDGSHRLDINALGSVRDFERTVFNASDASRRAVFEPTADVMRTLAESKIPFHFSSEYMLARGYQLAQNFARVSDWVGGTAVGRAPRAIREVVRRGFERFAMVENDLGVVGKAHGVDGIREYLTSTKAFEGAFANRDTMAPADKALAYLRSLAKGEMWNTDPVVEALKNAPLPSGYAADLTAQVAGGALKRLVEDETTTGAHLVNFVEKSLTGLYGSQLGKADNPDVVFRFVARAIGYGASQHDTVYDLLRATGGGIEANAARALNWFNIPEKGTLEAFDAESRKLASSAFGTPKLSEQRGALAHLFKADSVKTKLLKLGEIEGQEIYIPKALQEAMNQVPRELAKELKEFTSKGTYFGNRMDRLARLWRVTIVNGYFVPRAAYFVNNYVSDIFQTATTYGWKESARMAIQTAPSYVPFVGPRLQDRLFKAAETNSVLGALFDPVVKRVMGASEHDVVPFADGAVSARRAMQEAREDGCFDSLSTKELMEITRRTQPKWDPLNIPHHIELSARFMETIQSRNRLGVYLRSRMEGLTRVEARDKLVEALYDWKTGVPAWEHSTIGRVGVFWSYRRNMLRQLGAALTEGISDPSVQLGWKAMTGQTKLGRTMKVGRAFDALPDVLYWKDPHEQLDDEDQLHELGMSSAPWWVTSQAILGNREISKQRKLWTGFDGRDVTFETLMLPAITTLDQLYLMNLFAQTGGATMVHLGEKAGLSPNMTTVTADEIYEKNISYFTDMLAPGLDEFANNALRANLTSEGPEVSAKGVPVPIATALFLKRLGWENFMAAAPDPDGQVRVDANMYGLLTSMILSLPPVTDLTKNWMVFADNPGYQESLQTGMLEAMAGWTGLARPQAHNPFKSMDYASAEAERRLKTELSTTKKQVLPREQLKR